MEKFWLVWNTNRGLPTFKHVDQGVAIKEAERLAATNPRDPFFVLEATHCVRSVSVTVEKLDSPESSW